jgi:cyclohexa-1,5-dienecarbonyl-CoA hydratase
MERKNKRNPVMTNEKDQFVKLDFQDAIATLTLNHPPLNVLHIPMLQQLEMLLNKAGQDQAVRVLVLKAEGKIFSAGVDVGDHTPDKVSEMIPLFDKVCQYLAGILVPTIAAVNGHALGGGCELVLCCDLAVLAEGTKIGQPEIQLAAFAPIAALRLPHLVGYRAAADMLFTGRNLGAQEALKMGLVNAVLPPEKVNDWAAEKAAQIAAMSGAAQRLNKRALGMGLGDWANQLPDVEKLYLEELMRTADAKEGLDAFLEKRPPVWKHK